jgi:adenylate kinase family enzyme
MLICFVGRHGAGKSTIGAKLAKYGYKHLSVGLLRRIGISGIYPSDVPASLIAAFRRTKAGEPLSISISEKLLKYALTFDKCILDGFPASVDHLKMLPSNATIALVCAPKSVRNLRLQHRSESTKRIWTPGGYSTREQELAEVLRIARVTRKTIFISNADDGTIAIEKILHLLQHKPTNSIATPFVCATNQS